RLPAGSTVQGEAKPKPRGVDRNVDVQVKRKSRESLLLTTATASWARLKPGASLELAPRSSATLARTLLQAFLVTQRMDAYAADLEDPSKVPRIPRPLAQVDVEGLRPNQAMAVRAALSLQEQGMLFVQGPPGTGKTTVVARVLSHAVRRKWSVLVTSHTHVAIDNALRKAIRADPLLATQVVRLGDAGVMAHDLVHLQGNLANYAPQEQEDGELDRSPLFASLYEEKAVAGMTLDALANALVRYQEQELRPFDLVIVDEAGMNLHPKLALAQAVGKRLMLVGDHQQLPPIVTAPGFRNDPGYCRSTFEALQAARGDLLVLLDEQFRCQPAIYQWSNDAVYGGAIHNRVPVRLPAAGLLGEPLISPVAWVDTQGWAASKGERVGSSWINRGHVAASLRIVEELVRSHGVPAEEIGYISPFRSQARLFEETLEATQLLGGASGDVTASTVDAFQGSERQVILYDLTTTMPRKPHEDHRRLNVSLTRAQELLVLIGPRPFVPDAKANPWYWSLQNWAAPQVIPFDAGLVPPSFLAQVRPRQQGQVGRPVAPA
ncbi:MAG: DEAD/DEAH box helicase, partial [Thermoplasmatota archaeon]